MKTTTVWSLLVISLIWMPCAHSASFDCAKSKTKTEKLICANPKLSDLDEKVSALDEKVLELSPVPEDSKEQQREWVKGERDTFKDSACLEQAYASRISDLEEELKNLPFKPSLETPLLAVEPISPEEVAAEITNKEPFELTGHILSDHDVAGAKYIIVSAKKFYTIRYVWDLTDAQKEVLDKIGEGNQYVLLKGQLVTYKDGSKNIDPK